jgi:hypothetical protein
LLLTGSAAAGDAARGADVDMLVIVAPGRLASAFLVLACLSRAVSRRVLCPNHYLSAEHLRLADRDLYVAHELSQARPLAGCALALRAANEWVEDVLPNARLTGAPVAPLPFGGPLQRMLERPLCARAGDAVERLARRVALARLTAHHAAWGSAPPAKAIAALAAGRELRFHGASDHADRLVRYERVRARLGGRLRTHAVQRARDRRAEV